jgi:hypothetical protein
MRKRRVIANDRRWCFSLTGKRGQYRPYLMGLYLINVPMSKRLSPITNRVILAPLGLVSLQRHHISLVLVKEFVEGVLASLLRNISPSNNVRFCQRHPLPCFLQRGEGSRQCPLSFSLNSSTVRYDTILRSVRIDRPHTSCSSSLEQEANEKTTGEGTPEKSGVIASSGVFRAGQ